MSQDIDHDPLLLGRHVDPAMPLDAMRRPNREHRAGRHVAAAARDATPVAGVAMPASTAPAPVLEAWESLLATRYRSSVAMIERLLDQYSSRPASRR